MALVKDFKKIIQKENKHVVFLLHLLSQETNGLSSQFKPQSIYDFVCILRGLKLSKRYKGKTKRKENLLSFFFFYLYLYYLGLLLFVLFCNYLKIKKLVSVIGNS